MAIVTEFCEMGSLKKLLENNKKIPITKLLAIARDVAKGMIHLHNEHIYHRVSSESINDFDRLGPFSSKYFGNKSERRVVM